MTDRVKVIAEYGQTMGGSIDEAIQQVKAAADAGCWGYKTQFLTPDKIAAADAPIYWNHGPDVADQRDAFTQAGLIGYDEWLPVLEACVHHGLVFVASAFDLDAVDAVARLHSVRPDHVRLKIASGDITNRPLIEKAARATTEVPVILSTGAADNSEVWRAVDLYSQEFRRFHGRYSGWGQMTVLACSLVYPTPVAQARLDRLRSLKRTNREVYVGYSDHTSDPRTALAAAALGAYMLEVHCTLRPHADDCADHDMALDPAGLKAYVEAADLGSRMVRWDGTVDPEAPARVGARRSIRAARSLPVGTLIQFEDLEFLRPGDGVSPWEYPRMVGHRLRVTVEEGELMPDPDDAESWEWTVTQHPDKLSGREATGE